MKMNSSDLGCEHLHTCIKTEKACTAIFSEVTRVPLLALTSPRAHLGHSEDEQIHRTIIHLSK